MVAVGWQIATPEWGGVALHGRCAAYGNGVWVISGQDSTNSPTLVNGMIYTASNPWGPWTANTSHPFTTDQDTVHNVYYGNGVWVAVGTAGKLATATDPTGTWTAHSNPGFGTDTIYRVYYANSVWVASSTTGKLATATDPTSTWTQRTTGFGGTDTIDDIRYANSIWVICGTGGRVATASDPTSTWTSHTNTGTTQELMSVDYGDSLWVGLGRTGAIVHVADPTGTWTLNSGAGVTSGSDLRFRIRFANGGWAVSGQWENMYTVDDPTGAWTQYISGDWATGTNQSKYDIVHNNGLWLMAGNWSDCHYAVDNAVYSTWNPVPNGDSSIGNFTDDGGGTTNIYTNVDEAIGSPDGSGVKTAAATTTPQTVVFTLSDPPGDLDPATVVSTTRLRYKQSGRSDDSIGLATKIATGGGTNLLAANSGGTARDIYTTGAIATVYTTTNERGFPYTNRAASSTDWGNGLLTITFTRTSSMGADSISYFIDAVEFLVYYKPTGPPPTSAPPRVRRLQRLAMLTR